MKARHLAALMLTAGMTASIYAAPDKAPQDVNVVNTPNVTVTNPQTSVTVDNSDGNPVPVSGAVTIGNTTPIPVNVENNPSNSIFQFVGFTSGIFNGEQGVITYTTACQQDFPGSRMCTSVEFLNTVNYPSSLPSANAWIKPVFQTMASTGSAQNNYYLDASGMNSGPDTSMSCNGWATVSGSGITVSSRGSFVLAGCSIPRPVACCVPQ